MGDSGSSGDPGMPNCRDNEIPGAGHGIKVAAKLSTTILVISGANIE